MSGNNICVTELSCADSPLSTTGSVIGILTLAYAVFITIMFQVNALAGVDAEIDELIGRLRGEFQSLEQTIELFREFEDRIPEPKRRNLRFTAQEAANIVRNNATPILLADAADCEWLPWSLRRLFRRNYFLREKERVHNDLQRVIENRVRVEGMCNKALNSLIILEIEKQNTKTKQLHDTIRTQNSMLEQIMGAFRLTIPGVPGDPGFSGGPDEEGSIPPSQPEGSDVHKYNLRPPSRLDTSVPGSDSTA